MKKTKTYLKENISLPLNKTNNMNKSLQRLIKEEIFRAKCWIIIEAKSKKKKGKDEKKPEKAEKIKKEVSLQDFVHDYKISNEEITNTYNNVIPQIEKIESLDTNSKKILPVFNKLINTFQNKELVVVGYLSKVLDEKNSDLIDEKEKKNIILAFKNLSQKQSEFLNTLKKLEVEAAEKDTQKFFNEEEIEQDNKQLKEKPINEGIYDSLKDALDKVKMFLNKWYKQVRDNINSVYEAQDNFIRISKDSLRHI